MVTPGRSTGRKSQRKHEVLRARRMNNRMVPDYGIDRRRMIRAALLVALSAVAASAPLGCERSGSPCIGKGYNVLFVTLDTTRADHLGCYKPVDLGQTPNLDAFAADAVQFLNCKSASGATPQSHASIFTGLYPFQHGLRVIYARSGYRLDDDVPYLPATLRAAGWNTAAFLSSFTVSEFFGFDRAFQTFDNGLAEDGENVLRRESDGHYMWSVSAHQRRSGRTTDRAVEWLDGLSPDQPFFLWVHYWDPHDFDPRVPSTQPPREFVRPFLQDVPPRANEVQRAVYEAEVAFVDHHFGRLIKKLKELGQYKKTIVVVVGDHGEGLGEHGWWFHTILYEEQIHVPFILRVPGWSTGRKISKMVRTIDIYPTIVEALELPDTPKVTGRSLARLVHGREDTPRLAYADALNKFDLNSRILRWRPKAGNLYCATDGIWKLIWRLDHPEDSELYNLIDDPQEKKNLFTRDHAQAERLLGFLEKLDPFRTRPFPAGGAPQDPRALRALKSLGYIDDETTE